MRNAQKHHQGLDEQTPRRGRRERRELPLPARKRRYPSYKDLSKTAMRRENAKLGGRDGEPKRARSSTLSTGGDLMTPALETCNPVHDFERLLDATEAAQLVHCHVKTLERYARQGTIPGYKIHGRWYFRASELDSWVRAQVECVRHPCRST